MRNKIITAYERATLGIGILAHDFVWCLAKCLKKCLKLKTRLEFRLARLMSIWNLGIVNFVLVFLISAFLTPSRSLANSSSSLSDCSACVADFAILFTGRPHDNIWIQEVKAIQGFLDIMGWSHRAVNFSEINQGFLGQGAQRKFRGLIVPGGFMAPRVVDITAEGNKNVRDFVNSGGGYIGFCAGAHQAASRLVLAYVSKNSFDHSREEYGTVPYKLFDLFPGVAKAPYEWALFSKGPRVEELQINENLPTMQALGAKASLKTLYYGGPTFHIEQPPTGYEIWAWARAPEATTPAQNLRPQNEAYSAHFAPSIIKFNYGAGRVVLFSNHPVFLNRGSFLGQAIQGQAQPLRSTLENSKSSALTEDETSHHNLLNWNILQAAFRVISAEPVVPLMLSDLVQRIANRNFKTCSWVFSNGF